MCYITKANDYIRKIAHKGWYNLPDKIQRLCVLLLSCNK